MHDFVQENTRTHPISPIAQIYSSLHLAYSSQPQEQTPYPQRRFGVDARVLEELLLLLHGIERRAKLRDELALALKPSLVVPLPPARVFFSEGGRGGG